MPDQLNSMNPLHNWQIVTVALLAMLVAGCGSGKGKETAGTDEDGVDVADADSGDPKDHPVGQGKKKKLGKTVGTHIGQIPKDVWPEVWLKDPLAVAAEKGSAAAPAKSSGDDVQVAKGTTPKPEADPVKSTTPAVADKKAGANDWAALISGEVLAGESKTLKNSLNDKLANKGRYDSTYKDLRVDAAVLACLAGVAIEHPEAPSWKPRAKFVRDMAGEIANGSSANGEKFFLKVRPSYDKLDELMSGNEPPGLEPAADKLKLSEVAQRRYLMQRLDRAYNAIKLNVNTEAIFKKETAKVTQESSIIGLLSAIISTPDYDAADDPEYQKLTGELTKACLDVQAASKDQDFKAFLAALDRADRACKDCHMNFKP